MAFFTETSMTQGMSPFEPKRKFRWAISFSTIGNDATYMVKSVKKPSITSTISEHSYLNHILSILEK